MSLEPTCALRRHQGGKRLVSAEEQHHIALPKLFGAPAYARPAPSVEISHRPIDPDDLPLVVEMTEEEQAEIERLASQPPPSTPNPEPGLPARPFSLRALSERLRSLRD